MATDDPIPTPEEARLAEIRVRSLEYITSIGKQSKSCPLCGHDDWSVGSVALVPMRQGDVGTPFSNCGCPFIPVTCTTCGYTILVHEGYARGDMGGSNEADES